MPPSKQKVPLWLKNKNGTPRFTTTNDAIFYARLVYDDKPLVDQIEKSLYAARDELAILTRRENPNLDILMELAVKAQLFRECLDEIKRIQNELQNPKTR